MTRAGGAAARTLPSLGAVLAAVLLPAVGVPEGGPRIELAPRQGRHAVVVLGVDGAAIKGLKAGDPSLEEWRRILMVKVATGRSRDVPPVLGRYEVGRDALVFHPRFPLKPGLTYRVTFDPSSLPGGGTGDDVVTREVGLPAEAPPAPETRVDSIHPSSNVLPENLLRFYVHFSAPMRQGESYRFVHLREVGGDEVELPFLELPEELWDSEGRRLTLLLDPGRIKRGLVPHEEVGLALSAGRRYVLVVDREWRDARGAPLVEGLRREFRVAPPDRDSPDPGAWQVTEPAAGTREPLRLSFPEPLDEALLNRLIWVEDGSRRPVAGVVDTLDRGTGWTFVPERPWRAEAHRVRVDAALEDLAGNSVGRPFEVMNDGGGTAAPVASVIDLPFSPAGP